MSTFLEHNGKLMSFNDFCLSEAITHTETKFGTNEDMDNGESIHVHGYECAFFKHKHRGGTSYHSVVMDKETGEVGMGSSDRPSLYAGDYSHTRKGTSADAFGSFGKSMHVLQHLADKHDVKKIKFEGSDERLGKLYGKMTKSKPFLDGMKKHGWHYQGKDHEDYHVFER